VASLYADVEYFDFIYCDSELIEGTWHFEAADGGFHPFVT